MRVPVSPRPPDFCGRESCCVCFVDVPDKTIPLSMPKATNKPQKVTFSTIASKSIPSAEFTIGSQPTVEQPKSTIEVEYVNLPEPINNRTV